MLRKKSTVLRASLAARASGSGPIAASSKKKSPDLLAKGKQPIAWKKLGVEITAMQSGGDLQGFLQLQEKILALSPEELISAFDEVAALDLPDESKERLQRLLFHQLCEKDPELAMKHCFEQINAEDENMRFQLVRTMTNWAGKNPAAAADWFDQQIAAGKFDSKSLDGKNKARMQFESALIGALISTDLAAATARLKSLPEDQQSDTLCGFELTQGANLLAYANLVRGRLPQEAQEKVFAWHARNKVSEGYAGVTEYLDRIKATPTERAVCVEKAATARIRQLSQDKKVSREDIDTMREWVASQGPGTTDRLTGKVLGESMKANQKLSFPEAAVLAAHYHTASGNDETLIGFLTSFDLKKQPSEQVRDMISMISDAKQRDAILSRLK